jgi:hypothetical protein
MPMIPSSNGLKFAAAFGSVDRGVASARLTTISYGKERPLNDGSSEDAMAKNRQGQTALTSSAGN